MSVFLEKYCPRCRTTRLASEFYKNNKHKSGLSSYCKVCNSSYSKHKKRTKEGLVKRMYWSQRTNAKQRGHHLPFYTKQELKDWLYSQKIFHELYDNWKSSGFEKSLTPSCDRLDDYKSYTLDNLQVVTWIENNQRSHKDMISGVNNKRGKPVVGVNIYTGERFEFHSIHEAGRKTPADYQNIWKCIKGKYNSAGGYKWEYALKN